MSSGITLSAGVRANLLSLQNTAQLMQTTQNRLATGKKVTSALDNPINYFTSQSLQSRAGDLNSLLDSMSNGIQTIQAANNGLTAITTTLQSMQSTLNQAQQDSSWQSATYKIDSTTIGGGSVKTLSFTGGAVGTSQVDIDLNTVSGSPVGSTLSASGNYVAPSAAAPASISSGTYNGLTSTNTYSFKVNGQDINLTSATTGSQSGDTLAHAKTSIQSQLDARFGTGAFTVGSNTAGDGFKITGKADGSNDVVLGTQTATGGTLAVVAEQEGGTFTGLAAGQTYSFQVNGQTVSLNSTTGANLTAAKASIQSQLDTLFDPGDFTVSDNTAADGFQITGKADGSNNVNITNQASSGGAVVASHVGGAFTGLTAGQTYTFQVNGQAVNLTNGNAATRGAAVTEIQSQLDTLFTAGDFTVTDNGSGITITGKADGSNNVNITAQGSGGGATTSALGLGTTTQTHTGALAATTAGLGVGTTAQTSTGVLNQTTTGLALGTTTQTSNGSLADSYDFKVNGTSVTVAAGAGLGAAISSINTQLSAASSNANQFEAFNDSGKLGIREIAAGGTALTISGTDATAVFGGTLSNTGTATSTVKTVDQLVNAINTDAGLTGKVKATNDNGSLRITNLSTSDLSVTGASSTAVDGSSTTQTITGNTVRKSLVQQFNQLRDQLDKLAADSSYNGINLLNGDNLKLTLNETGSSAINVQAKDANGGVLSIDSSSLGVTQASNSDFDSGTSIAATLGKITSALSTLRSQSSSLGSNLSVVQNRQDFTKTMINTLQTGADNLVLADTNQEGANLLALQTRQSLSTTALSLSSQADQAVLSLFG